MINQINGCPLSTPLGDEMGSTNKSRLRTEVSWMSDEEHFCDCVVSYTGSFFLLVPFVIERTANRPTRVIQT